MYTELEAGPARQPWGLQLCSLTAWGRVGAQKMLELASWLLRFLGISRAAEHINPLATTLAPPRLSGHRGWQGTELLAAAPLRPPSPEAPACSPGARHPRAAVSSAFSVLGTCCCPPAAGGKRLRPLTRADASSPSRTRASQEAPLRAGRLSQALRILGARPPQCPSHCNLPSAR